MRLVRRIIVASPIVVLALNACLPYTVGSTARTIEPHQTSSATSWYYIPNAVKMPDDSIAAPMAGSNLEFRHGLDGRSDMGLRLMPGGVAVDYKRRLDGDATGTKTAFAYMAGGGIVNGGEHFMMQGTLIASGREDASVVPYGGLRAIHVLPITQGAVSDKPTIGVFGGLQLGDAHFTIRPELGVFYDRSALGLRRGDLILVPAVTLKRGRRQRELRNSERPQPALPATARDPRRTPVPIYAPRHD
jgi:hypothetical protein